MSHPGHNLDNKYPDPETVLITNRDKDVEMRWTDETESAVRYDSRPEVQNRAGVEAGVGVWS